MLQLPDNWQVRIIQLLAIPGLIISYFLLLYHNGNLVGVCSPSGWDDCGVVSGPGAPYSAIGPVPVALIGFVGYAVIFLLTWLPAWISRLDDYLPELLLGTIGLALIFTAALTALEIFVIHAVCRYCLISAAIIIVMFILAVSYLRKVNRSTEEIVIEEGQDETGTGQRLDVA
ncbi:MAG: vitamin K epoxide reductase family protein [Chloroflexota bacterium]|jgi:uncharacterized membrane protein